MTPDSGEDRLERLREAAIQAEYETGKREDTRAEAKANIAVRLVRISAGTLVTLAGVAMLALPGPGLLSIAAGLAILAQDVPFARRLLDRVEDRIPKDEQGEVPRSTYISAAVMGVIGIGGSIWWFVIR